MDTTPSTPSQDEAEEKLFSELFSLQEQLSALREAHARRDGADPLVDDSMPLKKPIRRLIIASYDLPIAPEVVPNANDKSRLGWNRFLYGPNPAREELAGLVHLLSSQSSSDYLWVGRLDVNLFESSELQLIQQDLLELHRVIPVFAYGQTFELHYDGFCKSVLWPLLHSITPNRMYRSSKEDNVASTWKAYLEVNEAFAQQILQVFDPESDVVWIHDYHLFLLPFMIRQQFPDATIGFFLHTPFCSSEIFRILPYRKQILQGMLASDVIGLQTFAYARHFLASCSRILGLTSSPNGVQCENGHFAHLRISPVGIDEKATRVESLSDDVQRRVAELRKEYEGKIVLVGIGKLAILAVALT